MHRTVRAAKYLARRGWKVIVLTPGEGGAALNCSPSEGRLAGVDVLNSAYHDRLARFRRSRSMLLGHSTRSHSTNGVLARRWLRKPKSALRQLVAFPDEHVGWLRGGVSAGLDRLKHGDVDLIFSTSPPETAHVIAARLHRHTGIPWVADFRDPWSFSHHRRRSYVMDSVHRLVEQRTLRGASAVVTVSEPWLKRLRDLHGPRTYRVIPNGFDPDDHVLLTPSGPSEDDGRDQDIFTMVYTGKLDPSAQDPTPLLQAVSEAVRTGAIPSNQIRVIFCCYGDPSPDFASLTSRFELSDVVRITGPVTHERSLALQNSADVLLLWGWASDAGVVSAKLFEYFAARRNILALTRPDSEVARLVRQAKAGRIATTPSEAKTILLEWFREHKRKGRIVYRGEPMEIDSHSFPQRAAALSELFNEVIRQGCAP